MRRDLTLEHIIPLGFGGNWEFPKASCKGCAKITGVFERVCLRTIFGPLRMTYRMKTRRKNERPSKLPLKVKFSPADPGWQDFLVDREEYPYIILMPKWQMPDDLSGYAQLTENSSATKTLWLKGSPRRNGIDAEYEALCRKYGFSNIMPIGKTNTDEFCRLLAKIAHAFAKAELVKNFQPYLNGMILSGNMKGVGIAGLAR